MAEPVNDGLRAEVKRLREEQAAAVQAERALLAEKERQLANKQLRRERNIIKGKAPDAEEPAAAAPPPPAPAKKEG